MPDFTPDQRSLAMGLIQGFLSSLMRDVSVELVMSDGKTNNHYCNDNTTLYLIRADGAFHEFHWTWNHSAEVDDNLRALAEYVTRVDEIGMLDGR